MVRTVIGATVLPMFLVLLVLPRIMLDCVRHSTRVCIQLTYQGGGWHQPLPEALLLECLALHLQVDCQRMRLLHLQSDLNQGHGRLRQDHQAHRVDRMAAHHSHAVGPDSPAVGAIRTAGSDRDGLAAGVREAGRERYCDSDHSFAGIDPAAGRHSRAEVAHVGHATVEGRSSTMV
jgi:hypothetical protein